MNSRLTMFKELRDKWSNEKDFYRTHELGSGVHNFVIDILTNPDLLDLKQGKLSTSLISRKNEFIYEKGAKERRRADFYIYINSEIAIPVEAECYENIQIGENQLFNYQKDFDKRYGILTDGFTWRFYNNNIYRTFTLGDMFDQTPLFITFWREYIKPEFYYLSFFEKVGQLALLEETKLHVEYNRQLFFEDITNLIKSFKNKLQIEGYLEGSDKKEKEKRSIELTYAYIIQFILYKTLVDNDFDDFAKEFEIIVGKIHQFLRQKRYKDILGIIEGISANISKNIYKSFTKEQEFIGDKIQKLYHSVENSLSDVSPWLDIFIFIKKYNFANVRNEIFGYIYENYLKELYEESKKGQYFTDPAIVNFMLDQIGYIPEEMAKRYDHDADSISIIDPSCGSGTFLYSATDTIVRAFSSNNEEDSKKIEEIVTNCVFGLDIEEFPLYLAEMNILMRMLSLIINEKYNNPIDKKIKVFKTRDSIAEFMDTALKNTLSDIDTEFKKNKGQIALFTEKLDLGYSSYVRDENDLEEMKKSLEIQVETPRRRFDYVIGNPPYVSLKECSKQKVLFLSLMKQRKMKLSDVYGVNLHSIPENPKRYAPNPNLYAFFIALGIALLKDHGRLSYIIPQTMLFAGDLDVLRYHLAKYTKIEKIITFNGKMFVGRGLKQNKPIYTSSLIFVLERVIPPLLHKVEVVNYNDPDSEVEEVLRDISFDKKVTKSKILQSDLLKNVSNWNFIKQSKEFIDFYNEYKRVSEDISIYYNHVLSNMNFKSKFFFDRGVKYPRNKVKPIGELNSVEYYFIPEKSKGVYFQRKSNFGIYRKLLDFPFGSQGEEVYRRKYKILWSYINYDRFRFSDESLVIDYNNVLISSDNNIELLFLFSLFNSKLSQRILNALFRNENEKDMLIGIKTIKEFIRVPRITDNNRRIKNLIITFTDQLLNLEKPTLKDLVDFSKIMVQKFNKVSVEGKKVILEREDEIVELPIKQDFTLIKKVIEAKYGQGGLELENETIVLSDLVSLPVIDFDKQKEIKDFIDNLVFCLYFGIDVPKDKLSDTAFVKSLCQKNKFYTQVQNI